MVISKPKNIKEVFKNIKRVHFIGIGGAKVSYLAYFFKRYLGVEVSGSNLVKNFFTRRLRKDLKIKIYLGEHKARHLNRNVQLVIHSLAVRYDNPEIVAARNLNIPILSAPQVVGIFTEHFPAICIAGTHGKGTTTALTSLIFKEAGLLKLSFVGMALKEFAGLNLHYNQKNKNGYFILESDEWQGDFLNYKPETICLVNIDYDHPDSFKNIDEAIELFKKFILKLPPKGNLIVNNDNQNIKKLLKDNVLLNFIKLKQIKISKFSRHDLITSRVDAIRRLKGDIILEDFLASFWVSKNYGISDEIIFRVFKTYTGAYRRFEVKHISEKGFILIDDYAHNPQKIMAIIESVRAMFKERPVYVIFEPHQIQRTYYLKDMLIESLSRADFVGILPIFEVRGREDAILKGAISSDVLVQGLSSRLVKTQHFLNYQQAAAFIQERHEEKCVIITIGAGTINEIYNLIRF